MSRDYYVVVVLGYMFFLYATLHAVRLSYAITEKLLTGLYP